MYHQELGSVLLHRIWIWYHFLHLKICQKITRQKTRKTSNEVQEVQVQYPFSCSAFPSPVRLRGKGLGLLWPSVLSENPTVIWMKMSPQLGFHKVLKIYCKTVRSSFTPQQSTRRHQKTLPRCAEHVSLVFIAAQVRDDRTMHEAKAVVHGEKMAANVWLGMWCK